jgi:hypothetical protein
MQVHSKPKLGQSGIKNLCALVYCAIVLAVSLGNTTTFAKLPDSSQPPLSDMPSTDRLPGVDLTEGIAQITGVAISPMLGVSSVGAWRYYHTPASQRDRLPWYCHPAVWACGFLLLGLCFLKDSFGAAAPPLVKKPLDMAELFEDKASAILASTAFIPFVASQMAQHFTTGQQVLYTTSPEVHYASVLPIYLGSLSVLHLVFLPLCIVAFLMVWLSAHVFNVLIALCPFGFIDALLKLAKIFLLSSVVLSYIINPYFGAAVSLLIICVAAFLSPWAFRLMVFGTLLATDTIFPRRARRRMRLEQAHAFLARPISKVPVRTFGHLSRGANGVIRFHYRPWLILAQRVVELPSGYLGISKGAFFPSLLHSQDGARFINIIMFPPRYRGQEIAIGTHLGIQDIRDGALIKGFKAVRAWLAETINIGKAKYVKFQSGRLT